MDEELIKCYVESSEPIINQQLRLGIVTEDVERFDASFIEGDVPEVLFRLLPVDCVKIIDNHICDLGYISCTDDLDKFIDKVGGDCIACLMIRIPSPHSRISVRDILPDHNDEGEFILPRNLRMRVINSRHFDDIVGFTEFLDIVGSFETAETLSDIYCFRRIDLYEVELSE